MRFYNLLTGVGALLGLACSFAFGDELFRHGIRANAIATANTRWVLDRTATRNNPTPEDGWFTPIEWDTSFCWEAGLASERCLTLHIQQDLSETIPGTGRPEDVTSKFTLELGKSGQPGVQTTWTADVFKPVVGCGWMPWIQKLERLQWLESRQLFLIQFALTNGLSEDTSHCLVGLDTSPQLLFVSKLPPNEPEWNLEENNRYLRVGSERIDLIQWSVETYEK